MLDILLPLNYNIKEVKEHNIKGVIIMRKSTIEQIIDCANFQLYKAQKLLVESEYMWNKSMNLKLYDACGMTKFEKEIAGGKVTIELGDKEASELFYSFCQDAFSTFQDMTFEDCNHFINFSEIADYVGRSSSFYLTEMHNDYKNKFAVALYQVASDLLSDIELKTENNMVQIDFEHTMGFYDEDYERLAVDLTYIINGITEHIENILKDVKMVYDYIENFKKEQKEMFTEYVFSVYNFND